MYMYVCMYENPLPHLANSTVFIFIFDLVLFFGCEGDSKEKRYFFCKRKWNHVQKCRTTSISDGSGYWKAIGKDKAINVTAAAVGTKKSFVFYQGTRPHALKTRWFMVEYRLVPSQTTTNSTQVPYPFSFLIL